MGILSKLFFNEEKPQDVDVGIADDKFNECGSTSNLWQYFYAMSVVENLLATVFGCTEWETILDGKSVKKNDYYRLNLQPNNRESATEFYSKVAKKLIGNGNCLIIELSDGQFFIADSFGFSAGYELYLKPNVFNNVVIGSNALPLRRTFKEGVDCIYIKNPKDDEMNALMNMQREYYDLKALINKGAKKAMGTKLNLKLNSQKNKYEKDYMDKMKEAFKPVMDSNDGLYITYAGEELVDMTEKQRGSEVEQIIQSVKNNIDVNTEILCNFGRVYGIPSSFMKMEITTDSEDAFNSFMTFFAKFFLNLISQKFTNYLLTKESIIAGNKIRARVDKVQFVDALSKATAIDKLISSSAYTADEVREKVGDEQPIENGNVRLITKNYASFNEYMKGGKR